MDFEVVLLSGRRIEMRGVPRSVTAGQLKRKLAEVTGVPVDRQRLMADGPVDDDAPIAEGSRVLMLPLRPPEELWAAGKFGTQSLNKWTSTRSTSSGCSAPCATPRERSPARPR